MPSTSGRAATYPKRTDKLRFFNELKDLRDNLRAKRQSSADSSICEQLSSKTWTYLQQCRIIFLTFISHSFISLYSILMIIVKWNIMMVKIKGIYWFRMQVNGVWQSRMSLETWSLRSLSKSYEGQSQRINCVCSIGKNIEWGHVYDNIIIADKSI